MDNFDNVVGQEESDLRIKSGSAIDAVSAHYQRLFHIEYYDFREFKFMVK